MSNDNVIRIFRTNKKETFYKTINTEFFFVPTLSLEAKGLLGICLSRPDDWAIYFGEMARHSSNGETSHRSAWKDLERHGYFHRNRYRNAAGQFIHEYNAYEHPSLNPHFSGIVEIPKKRNNPDVKITSGPENAQNSRRDFPHVESHEWKPTPGNPPVENQTLLNINQPSIDLPNTEKLSTNEPSTKKEKEISFSETITFVNVYEKTKELLASRNIEYVHTVGKETSALNWFMTSGLSADKIIEVVSNLIRIKESKEFKDDLKFWKPIPITIASAKSYYEKIQSTIVALKLPSSERPTQTNHQPDFEYFEDYIQAQKISPTTKQFILSAKSPEEYYDPNSTNPKITYAKSFYETFKKSKQDKGEPCKFKRPAAA
ncbi:hypothetical protein [Leptospira interrogans]|uniref:hypothetical protein n=1 Tax=Leptospira interrogans TaxID=173 RepID=UPI0002E1D266|nr:hypothetical protein [Leptospira interrogans]